MLYFALVNYASTLSLRLSPFYYQYIVSILHSKAEAIHNNNSTMSIRILATTHADLIGRSLMDRTTVAYFKGTCSNIFVNVPFQRMRSEIIAIYISLKTYIDISRTDHVMQSDLNKLNTLFYSLFEILTNRGKCNGCTKKSYHFTINFINSGAAFSNK